MTVTKARIGVVGTGWWSTTAHIPALIANPKAELVALCDRRTEALAKAAHSIPSVHTYSKLDEMLSKEQLDGVVICVNHSAHYEVAKICLEAGLHVMLDKPMVLFASHAHELMQLAAAQDLHLIVGYPWNYTENTRRARDIVQSGELGTIQYVSCLFTSMVIEFLRGNDEAYRRHFGYPVTGPGLAYADPTLSGGGQGHLQVTHSAAGLFFVTGLRAAVVTCFMENFGLAVDVADAIAARFEPVSGYSPVGVLGSSANLGIGDAGHQEIQVYGEKGRLSLNQMDGTLYIRKSDGAEQHYGPIPAEQRYPSQRPSENLVAVILGEGENGSPAEVGVRAVELLDAAYRSSAAGGQPVKIIDII